MTRLRGFAHLQIDRPVIRRGNPHFCDKALEGVSHHATTSKNRFSMSRNSHLLWIRRPHPGRQEIAGAQISGGLDAHA